MSKIRWGVLSTAKIARNKVIPAMQSGIHTQVTAIASSNTTVAQDIAAKNNIATVYDSYEALLADPEIDAVYIPLPNHLHVPWAIKALQAGKHVLCEKPIALSAAEATELLNESLKHPQLKVMEAFMYRFHPQWHAVKKLLQQGRIGEIKSIQSAFSYFNTDPANVRNQKDIGGGGLMDIGCYSISIARFIFEKEPVRVFGSLEMDTVFKTDKLATGIMDFSSATSMFTCSTQAMPFQYATILGTEGTITLELPFTPPPDSPAIIILNTKDGNERMSVDGADQYTLQGDQFSLSILNNLPVPTPLTDAVNNMKVIEAIFLSAENGAWQNL
ncbi:Gfo/Idh/MocA family protein [Ferruginibacter sp. HRS2-29]|uniref:Gfo/Idh/MocA family protein n=1 Tax=Ferruginibacter sp. HRS2-29 TaxID=2487334 RepID=UPI0020CC61A8|nr:Gfo/Idh/MocA family oxidoreductase [Ferruginibacter sp. HRS2-29]MCP9753467.1 gfo/Idh/MocA family oxidoreductase [Ferruginibacter sp. HRS2-29]